MHKHLRIAINDYKDGRKEEVVVRFYEFRNAVINYCIVNIRRFEMIYIFMKTHLLLAGSKLTH